MQAGLQLVFQNWHDGCTDEQMLRCELGLGVRAEALGFDVVWSVEHHFDDYAMCPDNTQLLSWLAARTQRIGLGLGAVILPWNDPLRVVEKVILLDHLSRGRVLLGVGRGLAKMEYDGFGVDMAEARDRFDEAAAMVLTGLESGVVEGRGRYYRQARVSVRPGPAGSFAGRLYAVAMSPDSAVAAAELGAVMMAFVQGPIEQHAAQVEAWRARWRALRSTPPPPPVLTDLVLCHSDPDEAERLARKHMGAYFLSLVKHYDVAGTHFAATTGYEAYAEAAQGLRDGGLPAAADAFVEAQIWGTPEEILERYRRRQEVVGAFSPNVCVSYAGLPFDVAHRSLELFASEVLPGLRRREAPIGSTV